MMLTAVLGQALIDRVRGGTWRERGLQMGLTTEKDLEEMAEAWEDWIGREDASVAMMSGEIVTDKLS